MKYLFLILTLILTTSVFAKTKGVAQRNAEYSRKSKTAVVAKKKDSSKFIEVYTDGVHGEPYLFLLSVVDIVSVSPTTIYYTNIADQRVTESGTQLCTANRVCGYVRQSYNQFKYSIKDSDLIKIIKQ